MVRGHLIQDVYRLNSLLRRLFADGADHRFSSSVRHATDTLFAVVCMGAGDTCH